MPDQLCTFSNGANAESVSRGDNTVHLLRAPTDGNNAPVLSPTEPTREA
jgi:hypothetical protein